MSYFLDAGLFWFVSGFRWGNGAKQQTRRDIDEHLLSQQTRVLLDQHFLLIRIFLNNSGFFLSQIVLFTLFFVYAMRMCKLCISAFERQPRGS